MSEVSCMFIRNHLKHFFPFNVPLPFFDTPSFLTDDFFIGIEHIRVLSTFLMLFSLFIPSLKEKSHNSGSTQY